MQIEAFLPLPLRYSMFKIGSWVRDYAKKIIPIYVGILADVKVATLPGEETCTVTLSSCTSTGAEEACCKLTVDQVKQEVGVNAYASVGALPAAVFVGVLVCEVAGPIIMYPALR